MQTALFWFQAICTAAITATFVAYLLQLWQMPKASHTQNLLSIVQYIQEPARRNARTYVINVLRDKKLSDCDEKDREAVSKVSSTYDILDIVVRNRLVARHLVLENWGPSISLCFPVCKPWIEPMRKTAGRQYWDSFEWLFKEVRKTKA